MFWYLLSDAGILKEERNELRDDDDLRRVYKEKFNAIYGLGFINIINRPTRDVTDLKKGEELAGRRRVTRIIKTENPPVVCFIGRVASEKYIGSKDFSFGWQEPINNSRIFVMHFPLRGEAVVRTRELRDVMQATLDQNQA
jgi:TDG/mug DNA glycosylase family protein